MTPVPETTTGQDYEEDNIRSPMFKWIGIFALLSFSLGFAAAGFTNVREEPSDALNWGIFAGGLAVFGVALFLAYRLAKASSKQLVAPSEKRSNRLLLLSAAFGAVIGITLLVGADLLGDGASLFSNGPVPASIAAIVAAAWLIIMPWITASWLKTVDEHERETYNFGALIAFHLYILIVPAWWMGWRGGFLPEPQHMLIYLGALFVWSIAWLWRRMT